MTAMFWNMPARFFEDYKNTARIIALIRWLGYIPILFIIYCCYRRRDLIRLYKTTIIYAAFGQLAFTLPMAVYYFFLSFFTTRDLKSTILMCTIAHNTPTILEFSGHLTVAIGRFLGVVIGLRLNIYFLTLILLVATIPHYLALYITIFEGVPVPQPICSPLLFFHSFVIREPYTLYMYFPPCIAVLFNLVTLVYVFWHKKKRGVRADKARDEIFIALGLLVQSIVPAITIGSRGYVLWVRIFLIQVPATIATITEYTALLTVGLNTLASIVFIKAFRMEFMKLLGFKPQYIKENSITITTSIIFAAFGQFIMSQPITVYFIFLSFFTSRDIKSTALICTLTHNGATITEFSAHLVIPTVAIGRFLGIVIGLKLNVFFLIALLTIITAPHVAALYITVVDGVPVPYLDCSPVLFFADERLRPPYNYYMYFPPIIAVAFNLGTLAYVYWHKSQRGTQTSATKARDELLVTLGLLAQSIVPAITISSRAYFMWIDFFLIEVPKVLESIVEYTSYFTVGLNMLASIAFIKPFRQEFLRLVGRPFNLGNTQEPSAVTVQIRSI